MTSFNGFLGIGHLSIVGWLTVILYFWAAIRCWIIVRALRWAAASVEKAKELRCWRSMMAAFFALGVSKQFNLQAALSETGRAIARFQGWYGQRQSAQLAFVLVMAILSLIAAIVLVRWARNAPVSTWLALAASTMLIGYWVIRATSFHAFDRLVDDVRIGGIRLDSFLEIGGIAAVLVASYWRQFEIRKLKHRSL
jgi:hypothetical protein